MHKHIAVFLDELFRDIGIFFCCVAGYRFTAGHSPSDSWVGPAIVFVIVIVIRWWLWSDGKPPRQSTEQCNQRDRFATWFVSNPFMGVLLRLANPIFLWSQLRIADAAGIKITWGHLCGDVTVNQVAEPKEPPHEL